MTNFCKPQYTLLYPWIRSSWTNTYYAVVTRDKHSYKAGKEFVPVTELTLLLGNSRILLLPSVLSIWVTLYCKRGASCCPLWSSPGGFEVPSTPDYLLVVDRSLWWAWCGHLAPLLWVLHPDSISLAPLFAPISVHYRASVIGGFGWTPSPCFSRAPPGLQFKVCRWQIALMGFVEASCPSVKGSSPW